MPLPTPEEVRRGKTKSRGLPSPAELSTRNQPTGPAPSVVIKPQPTPQLTDVLQKEGYSLPRMTAPQASLPSQGITQAMVERSRQAPSPIAQDITRSAIARSQENQIPPTTGQRIVGAARTVGHALNDFPAEFTDSATFGLSNWTGRALGVETLEEQRARNARIGGKAGQFAGYLMPGAAIERGVTMAAKPLIQNMPRAARLATTGAAAGAIEAAAQETGDVVFREQTFDPLNVAIGSAAGGAIGAAIPGIGKGVERLLNAIRPKQAPKSPTLALPAPRQRGNTNTAQTPDVITNPYTFKLPEGTDQTRNIQSTWDELAELNDEIRKLEIRYQQAVNEEYQFLKQSLKDRGGVQQGKIFTNADGEVIDRVGRISNNPKWYQDFYKETGRVPTNKDLYELSKTRVDNGFMDEMGKVPSWREQNNYDEAFQAYTQVRDDVRSVLKERGIGLTDAKLKDEVLAYPGPRTKPTPRPTQTDTLTPLSEPVRRTQSAAQSQQQRGFINTLSQSENLSNEARQALERSTNRFYTPSRNVDTVERSNARINADPDAAEAFVLRGVKADPEQITTGMRLIQRFQESGQVERAVTIAEKLAEKLTRAGQTVQAASIWNRLTPEGALVAAQRKVAAINEKATKLSKPVEVTKHNAEDIMTAAGAIQRAGASQERAAKVLDIADRLKKGEKISAAERELVNEFVKDLQSYVKPTKAQKSPKIPKEMNEPRVRDKVISVLEEQERKARERLKARGIQISSTPIDVWADMAYVVALKMAKGTIKLVDLTEQMVKEFGESVRPHMQGIYERAQELIEQNSKKISNETVSKVRKATSKLTDEEIAEREAEKALLEELTAKVREAISKSKNGTITDDELQVIRDLSEEVADIPSKVREISEEERFKSQVKSLAKKIAEVQSEKQPTSQSLREVQKLVRDVAKLTDEGAEKPNLPEIDEAITSLAYGLKERTKPRVLSKEEKIAESYIKKNARLTDGDIELIRGMAQRVSELSGEAQKAASMELQAVMNSFERAGIGRKVSTIQYISMLLNPVTQVRNIVGNEMLYRLERLNRLIATPADILVSKATGKPREVTFTKGPTAWENFFAPTRDYWKGLVVGSKAGWRGINPEGLTTSYDISGQSFRSKLNPLTYLEKTLGAVMKGFDYAAYNRAVTQRLREVAYLDALNSGVKGKDNIRNHMDKYMANLDDNISAIAKEYGRYITLQDDTILSKAATQGRRILNLYQDFGIGSLVLPFAKTPANLLMRAIEYSPAGFAKSIYQTAEILFKRNTDLTRAEVIQSATRALLGTGITGMGWFLADLGILTGEMPTDKDVRNLQRQSGMSQYQINGSALQRVLGAMVTGDMKEVRKVAKLREGDTLWQYEWAQPVSIPLAIGANIAQDRKSGENLNPLSAGYSAAIGGLNTLFNTSLLQGLQEAFEFPPGEDNKVGAFITNLAKSVPSMFTPSMLNRINMYIDSAQRESYTNDFEEYMKNTVKARVPGLAQDLPQRVDTLGQPMTRENTFFDVFLSPSQRSVYKPSEGAQMVMELLTETGDDRLAPRTVARKITGTDRKTGEQREIQLLPEQYVKYQRIVGEETTRLLDRINPNLRTEKKIERVLDALTKAAEKGRKEMRKELGLKP